jgi:H+-transporting ATPase
MADNNATSPPPAALESSVPTAPPQPRVRLPADAEDEDIDALIDDLESQDDHHLEEEEGQQFSSAIPEELLQTDTRTGLTEAEVVARRREYCPGELEQTENLILKFLLCFVQPKMLVNSLSNYRFLLRSLWPGADHRMLSALRVQYIAGWLLNNFS